MMLLSKQCGCLWNPSSSDVPVYKTGLTKEQKVSSKLTRTRSSCPPEKQYTENGEQENLHSSFFHFHPSAKISFHYCNLCLNAKGKKCITTLRVLSTLTLIRAQVIDSLPIICPAWVHHLYVCTWEWRACRQNVLKTCLFHWMQMKVSFMLKKYFVGQQKPPFWAKFGLVAISDLTWLPYFVDHWFRCRSNNPWVLFLGTLLITICGMHESPFKIMPALPDKWYNYAFRYNVLGKKVLNCLIGAKTLQIALHCSFSDGRSILFPEVRVFYWHAVIFCRLPMFSLKTFISSLAYRIYILVSLIV